MVHLDQPLFMFDLRGEDPSDGIHGELVPVCDDEPTDCPIENLGCDTRTVWSRVGLVLYLYPFVEDCLLSNMSIERCRDPYYLECLRLQYHPSY